MAGQVTVPTPPPDAIPLTPPSTGAPPPDAVPLQTGEVSIEHPVIRGVMQAAGGAGGFLLAAPEGGGILSPVTGAAGAAMGWAGATNLYDALQNLMDVTASPHKIRTLPSGLKGSGPSAPGKEVSLDQTPHQPMSLSQSTIDTLSQGAQAFGGQLGAEAGAVAGISRRFLPQVLSKLIGQPAEKIAGAVLYGSGATAATTFTMDQAKAAAKTFNLLPPDMQTPTLLGSITDAAISGGLDLVMGGSVAAGSQALRTGIKNILGLTPDAINLARLGNKLGIPLSVANVSNNEIARGYLKVVGAIPYLAHPYSAAAHEQVGLVKSKLTQMAEAIGGPGPVPSEAQLSTQAVNTAASNFDILAKDYNDQYAKVLADARALGPIIPTDMKGGNGELSLRDVGSAFLKNVKASTIPQVGAGGFVRGGRPAENISVDKMALSFAQRLQNLPKVISVDQANGLEAELETLFARAAKSGTKLHELTQLGDSIHAALANSKEPNYSYAGGIDTLGQQAQGTVGQRFRALDQSWSTMRQIYETATGQKFSMAQKNMFRAALTLPGSRPEDTLGRVLFSMQSPAQVAQLRDIVGEDLIHKGASAFLSEAAANATEGFGMGGKFNPDKFAKSLGLDNERSLRYSAVEEALTGGPTSMQDIKDFVKVAAATQNPPMADTATMIKRRLILGGAAAAAKFIFPIGVAFERHGLVSGATTLAGIMLGYKGSQIAGNPVALKNMIQAMDNSLPIMLRRVALFRVAKFALGTGLSGLRTGQTESTTSSSLPEVPNTP